MKIKKMLGIIFTVALATSMIGCGGQTADTTTKEAPASETSKTETAKPASEEKVKLRLMSLSTDENQIKILENYIKKNIAAELPNVEVEFEPGGGGEDYTNKMKTYNASGDLPDVWYSGAEYATAIIKAGNQLDFTESITGDGFIEKFAVPEAMKFSDGKVYALSAGADTYFTPRIFYHKDIFEQNGIAVPKTFDEFMTVCKTLKEKGIVPMSIMGKGGWGPQLYMVQTMIQGEDPQVALDLLQNKTDFTNPAVLQAVKKIETMAKEGVFPEGVANLDYGPSLELFTSKKTAMFGGFTWETANLGADSNIGMFMWPTSNDKYPTGDVTQYWGSPLNGYAVNANSENVEMAVKLAEYCVSQEALFYAEQGSKLNLQTGVTPAEQSELMKENIKLYENTKLKIPTIFLNAMDAKTGAEYGALGGNLLTGTYTAEQYVKDFNAIWQENTWFENK
ncbi:MAG: extracellular solute-binding protein family 1 [Clostridia bacterium]|jgi:raffinose/stachyose/melibiose transport system substrate-binding protein|nr:extracellular solute-binding protein family 1 [Clostridia bacterium]